MGEMTAVGQAHAEDGVAGVEQRQVHRGVGRGTGMHVDVGVVGAERLPGVLPCSTLSTLFAAAMRGSADSPRHASRLRQTAAAAN